MGQMEWAHYIEVYIGMIKNFWPQDNESNQIFGAHDEIQEHEEFHVLRFFSFLKAPN